MPHLLSLIAPAFAEPEQLRAVLVSGHVLACMSIFLKAVLPHSWCREGARVIGNKRARRSSKPARPYISRFRVLSRLMCPSTGPLLQLSFRAFFTASRS